MVRRLVRPALCRTLWALGVIDVLLGATLIGWPGIWQELLHPAAMGTVFYPVQRTGTLWLARGLFAGWAAWSRRPWAARAVAVAWALDVPGDLLLAWRVGDTGPWTGPAYLGRAAFAVAVAIGLGRGSRPRHLEGAADHG